MDVQRLARARASLAAGSHDGIRPSVVSPRAFSGAERTVVLDQLDGPRFVDLSVPQVHATMHDEGQYLCSPRTMYHILDAAGEVRERRDQLRHTRLRVGVRPPCGR